MGMISLESQQNVETNECKRTSKEEKRLKDFLYNFLIKVELQNNAPRHNAHESLSTWTPHYVLSIFQFTTTLVTVTPETPLWIALTNDGTLRGFDCIR